MTKKRSTPIQPPRLIRRGRRASPTGSVGRKTREDLKKGTGRGTKAPGEWRHPSVHRLSANMSKDHSLRMVANTGYGVAYPASSYGPLTYLPTIDGLR